MYKIIWIIILIAFAQCKTPLSNDIISENTVVRSDLDTTIIEKLKIYRGDTLKTYLTMVGDTIIEQRTSRYGKLDEEDMAMSRSHMKRGAAKGDMMAMETTMMDSRASKPVPSSMPHPPLGRIKPNVPQNPDAGQLTAGEWNDLSNWDDWKSLLNNNDYNEMQGHWGLYPTERYSVFVTNEDRLPLVDLKVELLDGTKVVWSARTDNGGKAELWSSFLSNKEIAKSQLKAKVYHNGNTYNVDIRKGGNVDLIIEDACNTTNAVEIMFVVDATGSMGDEITYLRSEVKDVIKKSTQNQSGVDVRIGSIFYRDINDNYLTTVSPLSNNLDRVYDFIGKQGAAGGGDYPEAVDAALEEALSQDWSDNAIARIVFLLLDAPPHDEAQVKSTIADQIQEAAERGIKIVPISASGINRETEFLLKFMAIATNGTYVFITDDSGIGNDHLEPVVDSYEVEKLNGLMTRLIQGYTTVGSCNAKVNVNKQVKIYPNPTSNYITVESQLDINEVRVLSNSGRVVFRTKNVEQNIRIDLSQYVAGLYTVQCVGTDFSYSYPVILVNE